MPLAACYILFLQPDIRADMNRTKTLLSSATFERMSTLIHNDMSRSGPVLKPPFAPCLVQYTLAAVNTLVQCVNLIETVRKLLKHPGYNATHNHLPVPKEYICIGRAGK